MMPPAERDPDPTLGRRLARLLLAVPRRYARALRRVRPTPEGWIFLATAMAVALAALNTGNNLLYLVFAAMLSFVVLSGVLSESSLRKVEVSRRLDERVFAGRPSQGTWVLKSRRRILPNFALDLDEVPGRHALLDGVGDATVPYLPGGGEVRRRARWVFACRGIHRLGRVRVSTTWPFGLLRKWFEVDLGCDVLVYPAPAEDWSGAMVSVAGRQGGGQPRASRGATGEMRGLRDHRSGEDLRSVHWRTSARLRRRVAVERDEEAGGRFEVRVDAPSPGPDLARRLAFEAAISRAAGAVIAATETGGEVTLRLPSEVLGPADGSAGRDRLLHRLAVLELEPA